MPSYYSVPIPLAAQSESRFVLPGVALRAMLVVTSILLMAGVLQHTTGALFASPTVARPLSIPGPLKTQPLRRDITRDAMEPSDVPEVFPETRPSFPAPLVASAMATSLATALPALASPVAATAASLIGLLVTALNVYQFLLFVRIILTWLPIDPYQPPLNYLCRITDPLMNGTRGIIPPIFGLDFGPTLVLLALNYCTNTLQAASYQLMFM